MKFIDFINKYNGKKVDYDGVFGAQCFTKDHYVLMADKTYRAIQEVKVGDKVMGAYSDINTVTKVFNSEKETIRVRTELSDLIVTPDHPFLAKNGRFYSASELCSIKPCYFDYAQKEESGLADNELLFLGFWLGDGSLAQHHDGRKAEIRVTVGDKKVPFLESLNLPLTYTKHSSGRGWNVTICKTGHEKLRDLIYSCYNGKKEKQLPLTFSNREYEFILQGLILADGYKKRNGHVISNTSLSLLLSIQAVALLLGYDTKAIREIRRSGKDIYINGKKVKSVKPIYRLSLNYTSRAKMLTHITPNGKAQVYNLETDGSHTYICNNFKVHNCVDLFRQYCKDVLEIPHTGGVDGAKDLWHKYSKLPGEVKYFDRIGAVSRFKYGDAVIWDSTQGNRYGHVAIFICKIDAETILVIEQNGFAQDGTKLSQRSTKNILGALRLKGSK